MVEMGGKISMIYMKSCEESQNFVFFLPLKFKSNIYFVEIENVIVSYFFWDAFQCIICASIRSSSLLKSY